MKHIRNGKKYALMWNAQSQYYEKNSNIDNISFRLCTDDKVWLRKVYEKLMDGGKANIVLREDDEGDVEGSLIDKYGICWILESKK